MKKESRASQGKDSSSNLKSTKKTSPNFEQKYSTKSYKNLDSKFVSPPTRSGFVYQSLGTGDKIAPI